MTADQYPKGKGETGDIEKPDGHSYAHPDVSGDAQSDETAEFSELSRLARESKSSWSDFASTPKSDRNFLRLIFITIILISGITLMAGYRLPSPSLNLSFLAESLANIVESLFPTKKESPVLVGESTEQQKKITALESQIVGLKKNEAQFKNRIIELEMVTQPLSKTTTLANVNISDQQASKLPLEPEPGSEPEPISKLVSKPEPASETPTLLEPAVKPVQIQGNWFINVGTFSDRVAAEALLSKVQTVLERAQLQEIRINNRPLHRIRARGYASQSDAQDKARRLRSELGLNTWIAKEK